MGFPRAFWGQPPRHPKEGKGLLCAFKHFFELDFDKTGLGFFTLWV